MGAGTVVTPEWEDSLVERDGTAADRDRSFEHEPLPAELEIGPVHDDDRPVVAEQQRRRDRTIDAVALTLQMGVSKQSVHRFDLMLHVGAPSQTAPQVRERELATAQQGPNDSRDG